MKILNWKLEKRNIILYFEKETSFIKLTPLEYKAFKKLIKKRICKYDELTIAMYGYKYRQKLEHDKNKIKSIIWRLNQKIQPIGHIYNYYREGYELYMNIGERRDGEK